jgi:hypothetical protein
MPAFAGIFINFSVASPSPPSVWCPPEVFPMTRSKFVVGSILCVTSFAGGMLVAQGGRHPNLRAAQDLINQAYDRITAAQQANEWDMGGHAARAKELLGQAKEQIRLATEAANHH